MRKSNLISIQNLLMAFAIIFTLTCTVGCKKDGCTNQYAENYDSDADDDDGSCILERTKFIGSYAAIETCGDGNDSYNFTIAQSSAGDNEVLVGNLFNEGGSVNAIIDGSTINIANQLNTTSATTINGSGTLTDTKLELTFTVENNGAADNCSVDANKQ